MSQAEQKAAKKQRKWKKKQAVEAEEKAAVEAKQEDQKSIVKSVMTGAEKLMSDVEKRVNENHEDLESVVKRT